jgi:hypothetical protein
MSDGDAAEPTELEPTRRTGSLKTRSFVLGGVLLVAAGAALFTWKQVKPVVESRKYASITYEVPKAPKLTPAKGETLYRIDPTESSLSYEVQEKFAGKRTSSATGTTNGIAGDIAVDPWTSTRAPASRRQPEQLHSDNNLRDARASTPESTNTRSPPSSPRSRARRQARRRRGPDVELAGDLTVKGSQAATFTGTASLEDGR